MSSSICLSSRSWSKADLELNWDVLRARIRLRDVRLAYRVFCSALDSPESTYPLNSRRLSIYNEPSLRSRPARLFARSNVEVSPVTWYSGTKIPKHSDNLSPDILEVSFSSVWGHIQRQSGIHKMVDLILCTVGAYLFSGHFACTALIISSSPL